MRAPSGQLRLLRVLVAALQLAAPGLVATADAVATRADLPITHVEATSSASCPTPHAPDCALCRYLSNAPSSPSEPDLGWTVANRATLAPSAEARAAAAPVALARSRAPPTA